jgi:hypothetical protein
MSDHGGIPIPKTHDKRMPNQTFSVWLRNETALYVSQFASLLGLLLYVGTFSYYVLKKTGSPKTTGADGQTPIEMFLSSINETLAYLNIGICIIFILVLIFILHKNDYGHYHVKESYRHLFGDSKGLGQNLIRRAKKSLVHFKLCLIHYWIYAIIYYFFTVVVKIFHLDEKSTEVFYIGLALNTYGAFVIYLCVRILVLSDQYKYKSLRPRSLPIWLRAYVGLGGYLLLMLLFWMVSHRTNESGRESANAVLEAISGIINMLAIAMLVARLDSKLIGLSSLLVSLIYGYALIQSLTALFTQHPIIKSLVILLALFFKIYFFIVIVYAMQTGRLLNFLCCNGELRNRLTQARERYWQKKSN